jgi:urocanate hydratase
LKRYNQGWVQEIEKDLKKLIERIAECKRNKISTSIAYHGNVVDLWEALLDHFNKTGEILADLGSDQTSLHNPYLGGYFPVQLKYEESIEMMHQNPNKFKQLVQER